VEQTKRSLPPTTDDILRRAAEVLQIEAQGILRVMGRLDEGFAALVRRIAGSPGNVIVSGLGKSGLVGRKISATLNSTGTRALFLHPVEARHGDLGQVSPGDMLIALSSSGETAELNALVPSIRRIGCGVAALTGDPQSTLARQSDIVIDVGVDCEACPMGLAPTASSTAMLAMGDALAVVLLECKPFDSEDFRRIHPGGFLGRRLASCVNDLMISGQDVPRIAPGATMAAAVAEIDRARLGAVLVVDDQQRLLGIVTDGDVRRMVMRHPDRRAREIGVGEVMTPSPRSVAAGEPTVKALNLMERHQITVLPVTDPSQGVVGILHLHDILGKGDFTFTAPG
jgi:arabinose-5-phosphate isomerase